MVANQPKPKQGTVNDLINRLLDKNYEKVARPVLNAVASSVTGTNTLIQQRLKELDAEVARLNEAGEKLKPDNPVLRALLADLDDTMKVNERMVNGASEAVQATGSNAAATIQRQLALPGMTDSQMKSIGIVWNKPDPEAVARLVGYSQSPEWAATLSKYGNDVVGIVNNQAIRGIASGWSPLKTAREVRNMTENMPGYQANSLMRTLQLTSYRDSTAINQQANTAIISQVIRIAALDSRTCLSCVALHGKVLWDSERDAGSPVPRVDDHYNGRCTSVVQVTGRKPLGIVSGPDWFSNLSEDRQRQQGGFANSPGKWEAYKNGDVTLQDFVHQHTDPTFGEMLGEASLTDALKGK